MRDVLVLNGPNLGRLGSREPDVYGSATFADLAQRCVAHGAERHLAVDVRQTDSESELIGWLHEAADRQVPVVLNPAAFTHYLLPLLRGDCRHIGGQRLAQVFQLDDFRNRHRLAVAVGPAPLHHTAPMACRSRIA